MKRVLLFLVLLAAFAAAACSPSTQAPGPDVRGTQSVNTTSGPVAYSNPDMLNLELTNARTGETFTLASFSGKVVYVEPMATWCTNCRQQLGRVREVFQQMDASQYVFVSISVETNISAADLATYADNQDFPWIFAVGTRDMLVELDSQFGSSALVPPSTPHFIINPDGTFSQLYTGFHEVPDMLSLLQQSAGV